ncbi:MAG: GerMN domain-containing protein [Patescibacteria group bacterium]|jgi:hypothetical protein|nr:GerMN domain-containing protein [Patescibacteria group bacterium]
MNKKIIFILVIAIILLVGLYFLGWKKNDEEKSKTDDLIHVFRPQANDFIADKLIIEGEARGKWFFEATAPFYILSSNFATLTSGFIEAKGDWMTEEFVPFYKEVEINFIPETERGYLLLKNDNPSGLPEKDVYHLIPLNFKIPETMIVRIYFNNSNLDPEFSCNKVFPVERRIIKTQAVAKAALEELLKGPTETEKKQGFFTSLNKDIKIQSINIKDGTAFVDFNEQLEFQVGGSCRVAAIRAQISETLKQFESIKNVIISINGRTEDILQP